MQIFVIIGIMAQNCKVGGGGGGGGGGGYVTVCNVLQ